jgi:hypothetical protein
MKTKNIVWKLVIAAGMCTVSALAQSADGGTIRQQCENALKTDGGAGSQCSGYMRGLLDANDLWFAALLKEKHLEVLTKFYCAPDNFQVKDAAKVFVEWIKKHPEYESQSAANAFVLAMRDKYSCK